MGKPENTKIAFMGTTFTVSELKKLNRLWVMVPDNLKKSYPKTHKKFLSILGMALHIAIQLEKGKEVDTKWHDK